MFKWLLKRKCFSYEEVEYLVKDILRQTIDRETMRIILDNELDELIGERLVHQIIEKINNMEKEVDPNKVVFWMNKINQLKRSKSLR